MLHPFSYLAALALLGIVSMPVTAADLPADVLAKSRWMELTRADYEQALTKLPENLRFEFSTSPRRVQGLLNNLLVTKTLAAQAKAIAEVRAKIGYEGEGDPKRDERDRAGLKLRRFEREVFNDL